MHDDVDEVLEAAGVDRGVDGVLLDLGVSSMQLDVDERGFSYSRDTPLDMRMGDEGMTAADVLNTYDARALVRLMRSHSDEKFADRIAKAVVAARAQEPFTTSGRLVELVYDAVPAAARRTGGHPAKRLFQALRIEVNDEIAGLARALPAWLAALAPGGVMVVLSYHSGEDRLVKRAFAAVTTVDVPHGPARGAAARPLRAAGPRGRQGHARRDRREPPRRLREAARRPEEARMSAPTASPPPAAVTAPPPGSGPPGPCRRAAADRAGDPRPRRRGRARPDAPRPHGGSPRCRGGPTRRPDRTARPRPEGPRRRGPRPRPHPATARPRGGRGRPAAPRPPPSGPPRWPCRGCCRGPPPGGARTRMRVLERPGPAAAGSASP